MTGATGDLVADLILSGEADTVDSAEELFLDHSMGDLLRLIDGPLPDEEFRRHPLVALLLARGSRGWEDDLR